MTTLVARGLVYGASRFAQAAYAAIPAGWAYLTYRAVKETDWKTGLPKVRILFFLGFLVLISFFLAGLPFYVRESG